MPKMIEHHFSSGNELTFHRVDFFDAIPEPYQTEAIRGGEHHIVTKIVGWFISQATILGYIVEKEGRYHRCWFR